MQARSVDGDIAISPATGTWDADRIVVLLLAAGVGSRLRPLTDTVPKCLVPIAGRPLLDHWFERIASAGLRDVLINTHHLADQVRDHIAETNRRGRLRVVEAHEPELLGSAGTIRTNREWMDGADHCVVIYADNFSNVDLARLIDLHVDHQDPLTMMLFRAPDPRRCGIAELDESHRIVSFVEKPEHPKSDLANAGLYVIRADGWNEIARGGAFDIGHEVLPGFVGRMRGYCFDNYHIDIGSLAALERARADAPRILNEAST